MLKLDQVKARLDGNRHVALEYRREKARSEWLGFTPYGLAKFSGSATEFERRFNIAIDQPLEEVALRLLRSTRSAFLPESGVADILLEIFTMTSTNGTDIASLDLKGLVAHYNKLAAAVGKGEVKNFKSKGEAVKRIEALGADAATLTERQETNKVNKAAEAERRLAPVKEKAAAKKAAAQKTTKNPTAAERLDKRASKVVADKSPKSSKADKPAKSEKVKKDLAPKAKGIGAFCMDLIKKGKDNAAVLEAVLEKFPDAKTSAASVAWYRNKLKSDGELV